MDDEAGYPGRPCVPRVAGLGVKSLALSIPGPAAKNPLLRPDCSVTCAVAAHGSLVIDRRSIHSQIPIPSCISHVYVKLTLYIISYYPKLLEGHFIQDDF